MQTERVTFLTSPDHKAALDAYAARNGQSVGHVLREAASKFISQPTAANDEEAELAALVAELSSAVPEMRASLERTASMIEKSVADVDRKLRAAGIRK